MKKFVIRSNLPQFFANLRFQGHRVDPPLLYICFTLVETLTQPGQTLLQRNRKADCPTSARLFECFAQFDCLLSFENKVQGPLGSLSNFFSRIFEEISYQFKQKNKMAKKFHFT